MVLSPLDQKDPLPSTLIMLRKAGSYPAFKLLFVGRKEMKASFGAEG